jgi:hypothetical protein
VTQTAALVFSIAIEATLAIVLAHVSGWSARMPAAIAATLGTLATHPLVWRGIEVSSDIVGYWPALAEIELAAILLESIVYRVLATATFARALVFSMAANCLSLAIGSWLYWFELV